MCVCKLLFKYNIFSKLEGYADKDSEFVNYR